MNRQRIDYRAALARVQRGVIDRDRWLEAFTRNLGTKALSLVIAIALWGFVNFGERDTEAAFKVALELRNIPTGMVITGPRSDDIDVRLIGPRTLLGRIDRTSLTVDLDLLGARPGPAVFTIGRERLNLPRGVRVARITPAQITLELERLTTKSVPVQLQIGNRPTSDFNISATQVMPDRVAVSGPISAVREIEFVTTQPLDLGNASVGEIQQVLDLAPLEEGTSFDASVVTALIRIEDVVVTRTIESVPLVLRDPRGQGRIRPSSVTLTLEGPQRLIRSLSLESIVAWIDVRNEGPGTFAAEPTVILPQGLRSVAITPAQVEVTFAAASSPQFANPEALR